MQEFTEITGAERELSWDDLIKNDGPDFVLLPEGDYKFTVTKMERARFAGSAKLPPCNQAILTLEVDGGALGKTSIRHNLYLHSKTEGLLCAFFECIGQRKHGEPLTPRWNALVGSTGLCKLEVHTFTGRSGDEVQSNQVKRFLPPEEPKLAEQQSLGGRGAF